MDDKDIVFTPHGIKDDEGDILDIEFEPDWDEETIQKEETKKIRSIKKP